MKQFNIFDELDAIYLEKFKAYHAKHPTVYKNFKKLAKEAKDVKKHKHFSARGLFQVMRFNLPSNKKPDGYKYNNNYTPFFVRLLEYELPEFKGFFNKRKSVSDNIPTTELIT